MKQDTVTVTRGSRHGRKGVLLQTPFHPNFGNALRASVPARYSEWVPERKSWFVAGEYREAAEQVVLQFFPSFRRVGGKENGQIVSRDGVVAVQESFAL